MEFLQERIGFTEKGDEILDSDVHLTVKSYYERLRASQISVTQTLTY